MIHPLKIIITIVILFIISMVFKFVLGAVLCVIVLAAYLIRLFLNPFNL